MSDTTLAPKSPATESLSGIAAGSGALLSRGRRWWRFWRELMVDLVFPPQCAHCALEFEVSPPSPLLCASCLSRLSSAVSRCAACARPTPNLKTPDGRCWSCRLERPAFGAARVLGSYEGDVRQAVLKIKHAAWEPLAIALGKLLARQIAAMPLPSQVDLVAPVPMYWLRRLARRTSAAQTLGEAIAGDLRITLAADLIRCRRMTKQQSSLPASERRNNVRGAYQVSSAYDLRGATILVVDDVITTAATCDEVARELKRAGAQCVFAAAVARTG